MTLGKRIKKARLMAGFNQQALATAISQFGDGRTVTRTAVVQWESETTRAIEAANLLKAAKVLNVTPEWLQFGTGHMRPTPAHLDGLLPIICNQRSLPIVDDASIERDKEDMEFDNIRSYIGIDQELANVTSPNTFALEIKGDSMAPEFKAGDIVIIDPDVKPQPGEVIVAKLQTEGTVTLRKYRPIGNDNEIFELIALNVDWPNILVNSENPAQIIGTLVEHRCRRRITA